MSSELLSKLREKRELLKTLKKEVKSRKKEASKENKKKAKDVLNEIRGSIKHSRKVEGKGVKIGDIINIGADVLDGINDIMEDGKVDVAEVIEETAEIVSENVDNELVSDIADGVDEILDDGKVDVIEVIEETAEVVSDHVENEVIQDIADGVEDVLEDGKVDLGEVVGEVSDIVQEHVENEVVKDLAKAAKMILEDGKTDLGEILGVTAEVFKEEIEKAGLTEIITTMADIFDGVTTLDELLKRGKEALKELAKQALKKLLGEFVDRFLNQGIKKELIKIKHYPARQKWGRLSMGMGLNLSMTGELSGKFTGEAIQINTQMSSVAWAEADLKLDVSFTIPVIKKEVKGFVTAAAKGDLHSNALAQIELTAKDMTLTGDLKKTTVITEHDLTLYLTIPEWIVDLWNGAAEWSFGFLDPIDDTFSKKIGRHKLMEIQVPGYKLSFSMKSFEFSGGVNGNFQITAGKDVALLTKKIEQYLPW
jgi:hypothetical protein